MMQNDWPTQENDLRIAKNIISKHIDFNDGEPLSVLECTISTSKEIDLELSDWIVELAETFNEKYGVSQGSLITDRIVSKCLFHGEKIH